MSIQSYRDLRVWQAAMDLAVGCHEATRTFPKDELFGLTNQIRRAAYSIPANIAEGHGRLHTKEYIHHLGIARGSLMETETHLELSHRIAILSTQSRDDFFAQTSEIGRMLNNLITSLKRQNKKT